MEHFSVLWYTSTVGKLKTSEKIINQIINLRKRGHSVSEISFQVGKSKSIVSRYIQNVEVLPEYISVLRKKQGGSKQRSNDLWLESKVLASKIIGKLESRDKLILLIGIYWGEGTKSELNIINSDPVLLRAFIDFIGELGVSKERIKASVRIYRNIDKNEAISFWSNILDLNKSHFFNTEIIDGNKKGKLEFGMCRLRVEKSSKEFKLLMSLINVVKNEILPL